MLREELVAALLRYAVLAAGGTAVALFGVTLLADAPLVPLTLGLVGLGLVSPFLLFGATGLGDETTAAGAEGGFVPDDTRRNRTGSGVVPGSDAIGLYLLGLGVCGLLAFGAVNVVG